MEKAWKWTARTTAELACTLIGTVVVFFFAHEWLGLDTYYAVMAASPGAVFGAWVGRKFGEDFWDILTYWQP